MKRLPPLPVILVSALYILAGGAGLVYHFQEGTGPDTGPGEFLWILVVRMIAVICGILLWLGLDRARWLGIAWLIYHVGLSAIHSLAETITHLVLLILVSVLLYLPASSTFFNRKVNDNGTA